MFTNCLICGGRVAREKSVHEKNKRVDYYRCLVCGEVCKITSYSKKESDGIFHKLFGKKN